MKKLTAIHQQIFSSFATCLLLMIWASPTITAQTKTCKFNFTNNTGETLRRTMSGATYGEEEYDIISNLPYSWRNGETVTLTYEANLGAYAPLVLALGEIPTIDFHYTDMEANPYNLKFAALPVYGTNGHPSVSASKCMINDDGRPSDLDPLNLCKGGNENGDPLFCVQTGDAGLDVRLTYGAFFLHYDHDKTLNAETNNYRSCISGIPEAETIQISRFGDSNQVLTSSNLDIEVRSLDNISSSIKTNWLFDLASRQIYIENGGQLYALGQTKSSFNLQFYGFNAPNAGKWTIDSNGRIKLDHSSFCLGMNGGLALCDDSKDQQRWKITQVDKVHRPIKLAKNPAKCMDNSGGGLENGNNIRLSDCKQLSAYQAWVFCDHEIHLGVDSDKCLDLNQSKTSNGNNIHLWDCNGTDAQKWIYDPIHKSFHSAVDLNKCIDLSNGNTSNGTNIQIWECQYGKYLPNQQWVVEDVMPAGLSGKNKAIKMAIQNDRCIDVDGVISTGNNIQLWSCNGTANQQWTFNGWQITLNANQNKCLDLSNGHTANGSNIQLWDCTSGNINQVWVYDGITQTIRSGKDWNKCLDVSGGNTTKGTNIQLWDCQTGNTNQQFVIY